jgi:hypothetical protein
VCIFVPFLKKDEFRTTFSQNGTTFSLRGTTFSSKMNVFWQIQCYSLYANIHTIVIVFLNKCIIKQENVKYIHYKIFIFCKPIAFVLFIFFNHNSHHKKDKFITSLPPLSHGAVKECAFFPLF